MFVCQNCGGCCGPIPVSNVELNAIRKAVAGLPKEAVDKLKSKNTGLTCIMRDQANKRCAIYNARPLVCRQQGYYQGLECPNSRAPVKPIIEGHRELEAQQVIGEQFAGVLGFTIGWEELEGKQC